MQSALPSRRQALAFGVSAGAVLLPAQVFAAAARAPSLVPGAAACVLTPEIEEGPYYFDPKLQRSDIRDGHEGAPLRLLLQVVDAADCAPAFGREGRRLALRRARFLLRLRGAGRRSGHVYGRAEVPAGRPDHRRKRPGDVRYDLSRLVSWAHHPHPYQGLPRRREGRHVPALLSRRAQRVHLREHQPLRRAQSRPRHHQRDRFRCPDGGDGRATFCSVKEEADRYLATLVVGIDRSAAAPVEADVPRRIRRRMDLPRATMVRRDQPPSTSASSCPVCRRFVAAAIHRGGVNSTIHAVMENEESNVTISPATLA